MHFEPWVAEGTLPPVGQARLDESAVMAGVGDALASLANFVGADRVMLGRVTPARLLAPLDGALQAAVSRPPRTGSSSRDGRSPSRPPA